MEEGAWVGASTIVFHSPQAGHLPIHLGLSAPQELQNHEVFALVAISLLTFKFEHFHILDLPILYPEAQGGAHNVPPLQPGGSGIDI